MNMLLINPPIIHNFEQFFVPISAQVPEHLYDASDISNVLLRDISLGTVAITVEIFNEVGGGVKVDQVQLGQVVIFL